MIRKPRSAVGWLAGITFAAFLIQLILPISTEFFMLRPDIFARPYILVTHMFVHGGIAHLLFNMYALIVFGGLLEQKIGSKRFLILYFSAGIIAGFISSFFYNAALGASGAIMGVLAGLILLMPNLRVLFFFAIPMPFWVAGIVWAAIDVFGVFFPSGTGNIAHLVGMAVGFIYGYYLKSKKREYKRTFQHKTHLNQEDINEYISKGRL